MRVTSSVLKNARRPQKETAPFKFVELLPLQLKNQVSGKSDKEASALCIHDMAVMFACMKANEFNELMCSKEIQTFEKCYKEQMKAKMDYKKQEQSGKDSPGAKNLTHRQLNRLLQKHPQFNEPRHKLYTQ